jgi:hypothetical protein
MSVLTHHQTALSVRLDRNLVHTPYSKATNCEHYSRRQLFVNAAIAASRDY